MLMRREEGGGRGKGGDPNDLRFGTSIGRFPRYSAASTAVKGLNVNSVQHAELCTSEARGLQTYFIIIIIVQRITSVFVPHKPCRGTSWRCGCLHSRGTPAHFQRASGRHRGLQL